MVRGDTPLTPLGRLRLARCVIDENWPLGCAAKRFRGAVGTAQQVGQALPCRGRDWHGRLVQPPAYEPTAYVDPA
ncbi:hypothetical protein FHR84_003571 [Actinopolyspora biskrensis]|uniref:Uncharacterized protein n=1 Tax=Actinopolyspora biskrensis TaxID=1470178 RepID=A0A852Z2I5_9ACTN|nr:hypothetical protein [Actinopolyspora biskrensis]